MVSGDMNSTSQPFPFLHKSAFLVAFGPQEAPVQGADSVTAAAVTQKRFLVCQAQLLARHMAHRVHEVS